VNETQVNVYENSKSPERVKDHINASSWKTWMTTTMFGFCHTLVYSKPLEPLEAMMVILKGDFRVMLHDPNFFVLRYQNFYIPYTLLDQPSGKNYFLVAKTKKRMRRSGKYDCNPDLSYNFENCVRTFLAETIGCLSPWDPRPLEVEGSFEVCNSTSEVERYEEYYDSISYQSQRKVEQMTGCKVPCTYQHYSLIDNPFTMHMGNYSYFTISYVSTDRTLEEEVLIYPLDSLISEFGGALGLFLGFSFLGFFGALRDLAARIFMQAPAAVSRSLE